MSDSVVQKKSRGSWEPISSIGSCGQKMSSAVMESALLPGRGNGGVMVAGSSSSILNPARMEPCEQENTAPANPPSSDPDQGTEAGSGSAERSPTAERRVNQMR